jgi:transcriptional regulator with XRE-family HTH domain
MTALSVTVEDRAASLVIEKARASRGMSKAELARRAGISLRTVAYYLDGERAMTLGAFRALCNVLELSHQEAAYRLDRELATLDDSGE